MQKPTTVVNVRCDDVDLATILEWFESDGIKVTSQSQLVRLAVKNLANIAVVNGKSRPKSFVEAREILMRVKQQRSMMPLLSKTRGTMMTQAVGEEMDVARQIYDRQQPQQFRDASSTLEDPNTLDDPQVTGPATRQVTAEDIQTAQRDMQAAREDEISQLFNSQKNKDYNKAPDMSPPEGMGNSVVKGNDVVKGD